ncbi:MAG: cache domain-containing protein [Campylobacterota bacterium]
MIFDFIKTNKYLSILFLFVIVSILTLFYIQSNHNNNNKLISKLENSLIFTKNLLEEEKKYALSLAILLREDKEIFNSFLKKDRKETFKLVNKKIQTLKRLQDSHTQVQIHNKDLTTYIRSWNLNIKDTPLESFRKGLVKVKNSKKPIVSIELGKRLNIKAISPFIKNSKYLGSIEVIIGFDGLTKKLKQNSLDMYVLLNNRFLKIATDERNKPKIDNYTLINDISMDKLKNLNLNNLEDYGYFTHNNHPFAYFSIYSLKREKLGYILISLEDKEKTNIKNSSYKKQINSLKNGVVIIE